MTARFAMTQIVMSNTKIRYPAPLIANTDGFSRLLLRGEALKTKAIPTIGAVTFVTYGSGCENANISATGRYDHTL